MESEGENQLEFQRLSNNVFPKIRFRTMIPSKMISSLVLATLCAASSAEYGHDYDNSFNGGYRVEPERNEYEEPQYLHESPMERSHSPTSDTNSYHLYHKDHPQPEHSYQQQDQPQNHHEPKHHNHDHGTSSMSFYQKVKHHEHKFKFDQKHGKHGSFHGYAHPYAYGGLKVHDW